MRKILLFVSLCFLTKVSFAQLTLSLSVQNSTCPGACNGSASVTVSGGSGSYTYLWAPQLPVPSTYSYVAGLCPGTLTLTVSDGIGNSASSIFTNTPSAPIVASITQTNVSCHGSCDGIATATASGGTTPYTFQWNPTVPNNLCAGIYSCNIIDYYGCYITKSFTITEPPQLVVTVTTTNVSCFGGNNGCATVSVSSGASPYSYTWTPSGLSTATACNLSAGSFSVCVQDAAGCIACTTSIITQPPPLTAIVSSTNVSCFGSNNGCASATLTGGTAPYMYNWAPTGPCGLSAGPYTFNGTDSKGCTVTQTIVITQPPQLMASTTSTNVTCNGACDGAIQATINGGTPPYHYLWAPGSATTNIISNLCSGSYSLTATDNNSCTANANGSIIQPLPITYSLSSTAESCPGCCDGSILVSNLQGGCPGYLITLNPGNISSGSGNFTNLCSMLYTVSIQDNCCPSAVTQTMCVDFNCSVPTSIVDNSKEISIINFNEIKNELTLINYSDILIIDINGKTVLQKEMLDKHHTIDLSMMSNGMYIIMASQKDNTTSRKKILKYTN